jgi:class 3 adenylate cyclase
VLVVAPGTAEERVVKILGQLFIGRECAGVDDAHRLVLDDPTISRQHLEIRLAPELDRASVVDHSTNGTRLNGLRIGKGMSAPIRPGDRITIGDLELEFRSQYYDGANRGDAGRTARRIEMSKLVMAVGDILDYSTIAQHTDSKVMLESLDATYGALGEILERHKGTLGDYAGDAMFAVWELEHLADGGERAVRFALEALEGMQEIGPSLPIRAPDNEPIRMGWGIVVGDAAMSALTGTLVTVIGDAANLAFRLAGIAARDDRPSVLATAALRDLVVDHFQWTQPLEVEVKGRTGRETVYGAAGLA